ncbi:N-acetylglucosamine-6-sulfatase, partial [Pseudomonas sp. MWU13-2625]
HQLAWDHSARGHGPGRLCHDTRLWSIQLWRLTLLCLCPGCGDPQLVARHFDLHRLLRPEEVAWRAAGQRCQPKLPELLAFLEATRHWLEQHRQPYRIIGGDWQARRQQAFEQVRQLLQA